ncbi:MAG: HEAT repeat domain-containing protein [Candidatus Riflebacteria bacterium]|nr:HEAT repeat domain-containing protein [Candidatus Riflebacteria bacterium]
MDSELSIILDLASPVRSFRLFAIEQAIREGASPEIFAALQTCLIEEKDEECRILLAHAISEVQRRLEGRGSLDGTGSIDPKSFFDRFTAQSTSGDRLQMLARLSSRSAPELVSTAVTLLDFETNPVVMAALIKTFAGAWPSDKLDLIVTRLTAPNLCLRLAALETLIQRAPDMVVRHLPALLTSSEPRESALAIRGLAAIDLDEALAHLENLLLSTDSARKQVGLQNCLFLPFERVKSLLFKFFASESDPALLERAGWLFEINPDPESPFHLYEVAEMAPPEKAAIVKNIISGACRVIEKSGLLGDGFRAYMAKLQSWIFRRSATRFVHECVGRLAGESDPGAELETSIRKSLEKNHIRAIFEEAVKWPISERARRRISELLEKSSSIDSTSLGQTQAPASKESPGADSTFAGTEATHRENVAPTASTSFPSDQYSAGSSPANAAVDVFSRRATSTDLPPELSLEDTIRRVAAWQPEQRDQVAQHLTRIIKDQSSSVALASTALRAASRIECDGLVEAANFWLNKTDPNSVSAALEYLSHFDADRLFPLLGKYLQSPHPRVKTGALKILKRFDPPQAVSMLRAMMNAKNPEQQAFAFGCMIHVDFSLLRDLLATFLETHPDTSHLRSILCLFHANPDPENLYILYRLEQILPGSEAGPLLREVRTETGRLLQSMGVLDESRLASLEAEFAARLVREQEKSKVPPAPYTVQALRQQEEDAGRLFPVLRELVQRLWFFPVAAAIAMVAWLWLSPPEEPSTTRVKSGGLLALPTDIRGSVIEVRSKAREIVLLSDDGVTVILDIPRLPSWSPKPGDTIKATITPYRLLGENIISARLNAVEPL